MDNKAVYAIAKNQQQAEHIVNQLMQAGFTKEGISVLFSDSHQTAASSEWTTTAERTNQPQTAGQPKRASGGLGHEMHTKAPEGAATGGLTGGIIGGTLGLLVGLGSIAIPGMGAFVAAGPLMAALAGSAVGGSIGLLTGALVGMGIPEYEAVYYAEKLKNGQNILIAVHANSSQEIDKVKNIFEKNGAEDIAYSREPAAPRKSGKW